MSDTFHDREKSFEAKFKLDAELKFKAEARRNKLVGLWAAGKMGLSGDDAAAYAKEVIDSDMEEPGIEDLIRKVMGDFADKGVAVSEDELRAEVTRAMAQVMDQLQKEYPNALGTDHS